MISLVVPNKSTCDLKSTIQSSLNSDTFCMMGSVGSYSCNQIIQLISLFFQLFHQTFYSSLAETFRFTSLWIRIEKKFVKSAHGSMQYLRNFASTSSVNLVEWFHLLTTKVDSTALHIFQIPTLQIAKKSIIVYTKGQVTKTH